MVTPELQDALNEPLPSMSQLEEWGSQNTEDSREKLVRAHLRLAYGIAHRTAQRVYAVHFDDLLMAAFEGLMDGVRRYKHRAGCHVTGWLTLVVRTHVSRFVRSELRKLRPLVFRPPPGGGEAPGLLVSGYTSLDVERAIDSLCQKDRQVVDALVFRGLSEKEAAHEMGTSKKAVERRWYKIRRRLEDAA